MLHCYAIKDDKMGIYNSPYFTRGEQEAIRAATRAVNTPGTNYTEFPEDYSLYLLGSLNEETGELTATPITSAKVCPLHVLVKKQQKAES